MESINQTAPIFIFSHARSGSTLLRYVLDTHSDVCSPAEVELGKLSSALIHTVNFTLGETTADLTDAGRQDAVAAAVRQRIVDIMGTYCQAKRKRRWCDKSISNIEYLDLLHDIFPDAQYLCLHRNCLDVVHSCLEASRTGFFGRLAYFVSRCPENTLDAIVDSWLETTCKLLDFERRYPGKCFRLKYEAFVADPSAVARSMFAFLGLEFSASLLDRVFSEAHDIGGDAKILFTSSIQPNLVGKGSTLPVQRISRDRLEKLNNLLKALEYPEIKPGRNARNPARNPQDHAARRFRTVGEVFHQYFPAQLRSQESQVQKLSGRVKFEVLGTSGEPAVWLFDPQMGVEGISAGDGDSACTLRLLADDLLKIANGELNAAEAYYQSKITPQGDRRLALEIGRLLLARDPQS